MAGRQRDLPARLGSLSLVEKTVASPDPDVCLAHLRLLTAFEKLQSCVGFQDGLWDVWDNRASSADNPLDIIVNLREKRWAVFVARAVDRYENWWRAFGPDMLLEKDMLQGSGSAPEKYESFFEATPLAWKPDMLPPLDVLLIWHTHMLNPRLYLEDCIRYGYGSFWASGMPWQLLNSAISDAFAYSAPEASKEAWKKKTGNDWENLRDPANKMLRCPACETAIEIPWTTCGLPKDYDGDTRPGLAGDGFGDGQLNQSCSKCNFQITHDTLRVGKFWNDMEAHTSDGIALPGTILDMKSGLPRLISKKTDDRLFPSQLAKWGVFDDLKDDLDEYAEDMPSMNAVREMAERIMGRAGAGRVKGTKGAISELSEGSRRYTKKMLARYWQNTSFASLDLIGSTMRIGIFTQKMCKIDWLHKPASRDIMERLLVKYGRFMDIVADNPDDLAVATLDVDLAWHTHQLSPKNYLAYTVCKARLFVDHPDKIDEDRLSAAFEWTCKKYIEEFESPYSECTCWYCESIRTMNEEDLLEEWHASGVTSSVPQPSGVESVHISAHAAVRTYEPQAVCEVNEVLRQDHHGKLWEAHSRATRKAAAGSTGKGRRRMRPRGQDTFDFWGKPVQVGGPETSVLAVLTTAAIYVVPPGIVECGSGVVGSCPCGTCVGCHGEFIGIRPT